MQLLAKNEELMKRNVELEAGVEALNAELLQLKGEYERKLKRL